MSRKKVRYLSNNWNILCQTVKIKTKSLTIATKAKMHAFG